jgi:hypothetical protein
MYNVFSSIILTTKGNNCIRDKRISMDAQKVYAKLLEAYHDLLSINLSATKLRQELTLVKLDEKWRKCYESFLHFLTTKIQDLEGIEDNPVDDKTKPTPLLVNLRWIPSHHNIVDYPWYQRLLNQDLCTIKKLNMVLSNAKLLDNTHSKQAGRRQETNQANRNYNSRGNNRNNCSCNANQKPCVA